MDYTARMYDPSLGRFAQADTIIPGGVQGLDRYAYVNNAPTRFTDPSGHKCVPVEECGGHGYGYSRNKKAAPKIVVFEDYTGSWSSFPDTMEAIENKAYLLGLKLASVLNRIERDLAKTLTASGDLYEAHHYSAQEAFLKIFGKPVTFTLLANQEDYAAEANYQGGINIYQPNWIATHPNIVIHELFHRLENILGIKNLALPPELRRTQDDYGTDPTYNGFFGGQYVGQFSLSDQLQYGYETLADMGLGWALNKWSDSDLGSQRRNYMDSLMTNLLLRFIP